MNVQTVCYKFSLKAVCAWKLVNQKYSEVKTFLCSLRNLKRLISMSNVVTFKFEDPAIEEEFEFD